MFNLEELELLKNITIKLNGQVVDIEVINEENIIINGQHKSISCGDNDTEVI